jgi:hypothetical protein
MTKNGRRIFSKNGFRNKNKIVLSINEQVRDFA